MLRKNFHWREDQKDFIESLPGDDADHIRRALDDYIEKRKKERSTASVSPSALLKGGLNGRPKSFPSASQE